MNELVQLTRVLVRVSLLQPRGTGHKNVLVINRKTLKSTSYVLRFVLLSEVFIRDMEIARPKKAHRTAKKKNQEQRTKTKEPRYRSQNT